MNLTTATHYETDFYLWTQQQAALLRQGLLSAVDIENIAEEIESMGKSDRRSVESHLFIIIAHLLKWQYQPQRRGKSWRLSIKNGRRDVERLLKDSPSLKRQLPDLAIGEYPGARNEAADETGLPLATFPESCPFTIEEITGDYWPD
jgi:hypothetical protein